MIDENYYPSRYKTAESRALYLTGVKGYGSVLQMAEDIKVNRSYLSQCMRESLPLKYVCYFANKFEYPPALLSYETFIQMYGGKGQGISPYKDFFLLQNFFNQSDQRYILNGSYITNPVKYLRTLNSKIGK